MDQGKTQSSKSRMTSNSKYHILQPYLPASVSLKIPSWLGHSSQLGVTPHLHASQNQGSVEFSEAELMIESLSPSTP